MDGRQKNARIKEIVREVTGTRNVSVRQDAGWVLITAQTQPGNVAEVERRLIEERLCSTYIGDYTPSIQPREACVSWN